MTKVIFVLALLGFSTAVFAQGEATAMKPGTTAPAADAQTAPSDTDGTVKIAKVHFVTPQDGATIPTKSKFKFAVDGLKTAPAGDTTIGTGHFHLIIDQPVVKEGQQLPKNKNHLHFAKGQSEAEVALTPGPHTLTLQFADGEHRAYNPMMAQTIKVIVK